MLAVLDPTDYRLTHERAQAALAVAEANHAHAHAEKERAENLLKTGGITDKDRLSAQVSLQVAEAAVGPGARRELAIAAQQLARTEIRAPFGGRVAKRLADAGAMLAAGTPRLHRRRRLRASSSAPPFPPPVRQGPVGAAVDGAGRRASPAAR